MDVNTQDRLNNAIIAVQRFANSRKLDNIHAAHSGLPLSTVTIGVLKEVVRSEPLSVSELGRAALMQPAGLSRQINILKDGGYIELSTDPTDRRVSIVSTTAEGRQAMDTFREVNGKLLSKQLKNWTDEEINLLANQIQRLVTDLRTYAPGET